MQQRKLVAGNPVLRSIDESDRRFGRYIRSSSSAMIVIRADGSIAMANARAHHVFGYAGEQLVGQRVEMLVPERFREPDPVSPHPLLGDLQSAWTEGRSSFHCVKAGGCEFLVEVVRGAMETNDGTMSVYTIAELTERLRQPMESAYLAAIVESSDDAIIGKDLDGTVKSWNPGAAAIFGYTTQEIIGRSILVLFPASRLAEETVIVERIKRGERVEHHETVRRCKNGTEIAVSVTVSPIRNSFNVVVGASTILRNITERQEAQRALALSEAEFRASFEGTAVGKVLAEANSRKMLRVNHAFAQMLGYEQHELVGCTSLEVTWPEDRALDADQYAQLLSGTSDACVGEKRYRRRDGTPLWVRVSSTLARMSDSNQAILAVVAIEDIDARYRAQAELLQAKQDLEKVVVERTAALEQRNLLLREVYHRVKNNLQIVDGLLMLQAGKTKDPDAKEGLMGLRSRIFALGLVHQQLMGSEDLSTFDIAPFLHELSRNIVEGGADHGVKLSVEAHPLKVGLDFAVPLGLLVTELVTNSLKHAFPQGVGNISVTLRPDADGKVVVTVSDDGAARSDGGDFMQYGNGLGAGIVKRLVAQVDGTIRVMSGTGTTTELRIPMPMQP